MSHDHSHDHDHDHSHSHGHTVPWSGATERWYAPGWADPLLRRAADAAELVADDVVVDIDCGEGWALCAAAAWVTRGALVGCGEAAQVARARAVTAGHPDVARLDFRAGGTDALPLTDGTASVAWSIGLSGWGDPAATVAELHRVLRPGGRLLIAAAAGACGIDPSAPDDPAPLKALLRSAGFRGVEVRRYRDGELRSVLLIASRSR
jgi:SAM-dependent methyltransferase